MTKRELIDKLEPFSDDQQVCFITFFGKDHIDNAVDVIAEVEGMKTLNKDAKEETVIGLFKD